MITQGWEPLSQDICFHMNLIPGWSFSIYREIQGNEVVLKGTVYLPGGTFLLLGGSISNLHPFFVIQKKHLSKKKSKKKITRSPLN